MKYWVYKESRILGPFDKEAVSGLPGLDSGTLICSGDPSGGAWTPAGEVEGLTGVLSGGVGGLFDDPPSSLGLLDQLQIDAAGVVGEHEFSGSFGDELFQDASYKSSFDQLRNARVSDEAEAGRARDTISDLTGQLEALHRKISSLETNQTELAHRLAAKDLELRSNQADLLRRLAEKDHELLANETELKRRLAEKDLELSSRVHEPPPAPSAVPAEGFSDKAAEDLSDKTPVKTFLSPAPPPIKGGPPPIAAVPPASLAPSEWPDVPAAQTPLFASVLPAPPPPAAPSLPPMPSFAAAPPPAEPPSVPVAPPAAPAAAPARAAGFGKPKFFKIGWAIKSFRVLGPEEPALPASTAPVPVFEPMVEAPAPSPAPLPIPAAVPEPIPVPVLLAPAVVPPPIPVIAAVPPPADIPQASFATAPVPTPAPITNPFTLPAQQTPYSPPPNTLSRALPVPDLWADTSMPPPADVSAASGAAPVTASARFAKPGPPPATGEVKKPARSNKAFLIGGGVLVTLLTVLGVIFMRQPKDDLKQMATLDDGAAPLGLPADDLSAPPPMVKPKVAEPDPAIALRSAAIAMVKDFPLDGGRVNVGHWLQYSYTADPNAGSEEWNASTTGDDTILVEYRWVPGAPNGKSALYLFEAASNGIVMGKNIEARQMLAGGPPAEAPKAKKTPVRKAAPKRAPKRRAVREEPKDVPLLPLPDSGELRPPAEDDGSFGSDTINSGI